MALTAIEFGGTASNVSEQIGFIMTLNRGNIGTISDINTESNSSYGVLQMKTISNVVNEYSFTFVN
jgi:hypothetical protein